MVLVHLARLRIPRSCFFAAFAALTLYGLLLAFHSTLINPYQTNLGENIYNENLAHQRKVNYDEKNGPFPPIPPIINSRTFFRKNTCRTSSWGPFLTVDSNSGVCRHHEIQQNGCCGPASFSPPVVMPLPLKKPESSDKTSETSKKEDCEIPKEEIKAQETRETKEEEAQLGAEPESTTRHPLYISNNKNRQESSNNPTQSASTCPTCLAEHQCCTQYEFCVSCCMEFTWSRFLEKSNLKETNNEKNDIGKQNNNDKNQNQGKTVLEVDKESLKSLMAGRQDETVVKEYTDASHDLFDWCLSRCRTSSRSVVHQNSFRSSLRYCYGTKDPPLLARNIQLGQTDGV